MHQFRWLSLLYTGQLGFSLCWLSEVTDNDARKAARIALQQSVKSNNTRALLNTASIITFPTDCHSYRHDDHIIWTNPANATANAAACDFALSIPGGTH